MAERGSRATSFSSLVRSAGEVEDSKARCRPKGDSVNDVLIAALGRVVKARSDRGAAIIVYTMDLRRYGTAPRLTATNTSSILTAHVPRQAIGGLSSTAAAVARITARQRRSLVGPAYVLTPMLLAGGSPHGVVRLLLRGILPATVDLPLSRGLLVTPAEGRRMAELFADIDTAETIEYKAGLFVRVHDDHGGPIRERYFEFRDDAHT